MIQFNRVRGYQEIERAIVEIDNEFAAQTETLRMAENFQRKTGQAHLNLVYIDAKYLFLLNEINSHLT